MTSSLSSEQQPCSGGTTGPEHSLRLTCQIKVFFSLSNALSLSQPEERALLDITAAQLASLRLSVAQTAGFDTAKLQRRVDYAIPILRRMLVALLPDKGLQ